MLTTATSSAAVIHWENHNHTGKQQVYLAISHDPVPSLLHPHSPAMNDLDAPLTFDHDLPSHVHLLKK